MTRSHLAAAAPAPGPVCDDAAKPRISVVVVDADAVVRDALPLLLRDAGIDVRAAVGSCGHALDVIRLYEPDVVLVGPELAGCDGFELVGKLVRAGVCAPIAVYASSEDESVAGAALAAGAAAVIARGRPVTQLAAALRSVTDGSLCLFAPDPEPGGRLRTRARVRGTDLSAAEVKVLELLAGGASTEGIAAELHVSPHTVRSHMRNLLRKLGAQTRTHAVALAVAKGLVRVPG